jgi:hypothetical protein
MIAAWSYDFIYKRYKRSPEIVVWHILFTIWHGGVSVTVWGGIDP